VEENERLVGDAPVCVMVPGLSIELGKNVIEPGLVSPALLVELQVIITSQEVVRVVVPTVLPVVIVTVVGLNEPYSVPPMSGVIVTLEVAG
jgi:hypothetical protein